MRSSRSASRAQFASRKSQLVRNSHPRRARRPSAVPTVAALRAPRR
jgi:hypothetical protein